MSSLGTQEIDVSKIDMGERLRPISIPHAQLIAENIRESGRLRTPIEIRAGKNGRFKLTFGAHRLYAVRDILKLPKIRAEVTNATDEEARIAEIDENLVRHELNPLDRAVFLAERKAIYERLHPETKKGTAGAAARHHATEIISFARETAEKCGLTDRTIRLSVAIAQGLTQETRAAIAGTYLTHKQADLIALAKLTPAEQKKAVAGLLAKEPKWTSVREAIDAIAGRKPKKVDGFARLVLMWNKATAAERRQFREFVNSKDGQRTVRAAAE
jgi:ParB family chromosome partitioning protein